MTPRLIIFASLSLQQLGKAWLISPTGLPTPVDLTTVDGDTIDSIELYLDARDCFETRITLPARGDDQARAAAGFAIEDDLAQAIDDMHVAVGPADSDQMRTVIAVHAAALDGVLKQCRALGLAPDLITSETLLLGPADKPVFLALDDRLIFRVVGGRAGGVDWSIADMILPSLMAPDGAVHCIDARHQKENALPAHWATDIPASFSQYMVTTLAKQPLVNLCQGALRKRVNLRNVWAVWRRAAMGAGVAIALGLGYLIVDGFSLKSRVAAYDRDSAALMQSAFPGVRNIPHMMQRLESQQSAAGDAFLGLSALSLSALQQIGTIKLDAMRFDAARGEVALTLLASSFADVQRLKDIIANSGAVLTEGSSRQSEGAIISEVTVRSGQL